MTTRSAWALVGVLMLASPAALAQDPAPGADAGADNPCRAHLFAGDEALDCYIDVTCGEAEATDEHARCVSRVVQWREDHLTAIRSRLPAFTRSSAEPVAPPAPPVLGADGVVEDGAGED